jgi:membrane-associated phospholipid phosphatase
MSTVFLKQHSIVDVVGAFVMAAVFYIPVYVINAEKVTKINSIKTLENSQE